jgi:hypothetical protein
MSDEPNNHEQSADGWEYAIVEVMGHRSHAGRGREEEKFGAKMLRIDVPIKGDTANGWQTHLYAAGAIFSLRYSDELTVMKANKPYESPYRLSYREPEMEIVEVEVTREDEPEMPF